MHHPTDRITHTFVTPVVEHWLDREIAQWVHPMKDWLYDPSHHERTLLPRSYIMLKSRSVSSITEKLNGGRLRTLGWLDSSNRSPSPTLDQESGGLGTCVQSCVCVISILCTMLSYACFVLIILCTKLCLCYIDLVYNVKLRLFCTDHLVYKVVSVLYRSCVQC